MSLSPGTQEPATQSLADTTAAEVSTKSPQEPPVQSTGDTLVQKARAADPQEPPVHITGAVTAADSQLAAGTQEPTTQRVVETTATVERSPQEPLPQSGGEAHEDD